jgi:ATP-dependent Lon protease
VAEELDEKGVQAPAAGEEASEVTIPKVLPILALKNAVIFPLTISPIAVGEKRSLAAVEKSVSGDRLLATFAIKPESMGKESLAQDDIYHVGTAVSIVKFLRMPDQTMRLLVQGLQKIRLDKLTAQAPFLAAEVTPLEEKAETTTRIEAHKRNVLDRLGRIVSMVSYLPEEIHTAAMSIEDPLALIYLVATTFRFPLPEKQAILEAEKTEDKFLKLLSVLNRELEILELGGKIQSQVHDEMTKSQRDYFLREQLKAIRQELGETEEGQAEIAEIAEKVKKLKAVAEVKRQAEKELERLKTIPSASPEYHVIRTYLSWLTDLPWSKGTRDNLDLARAQKVLDDDHYDLEKVKERIVEYLAVRKLKKDMKGPILCFIGPPGVGKTSLGQSISRALGRKFVRISLGGVHDEAEIRGHRRTYVGALPGRIIQGIARAGTNNPVFMMDEIDKVGADFRGDPSSALLEVLDPEQNATFRDHYLDVPFDLSKVLFITTANVGQTIHPALRDRMETIELPGYTTEEKLKIAQQYLIPRQIEENGLAKHPIVFEDAAITKIVESYTREAGVRNLEREIARVCRKVARSVGLGEKAPRAIKAADLKEFLGAETIFPEEARRTSIPGVATGLAWTAAGGDVLFVEAIKMPGKRTVTLTGQLGQVMQESAKAALSYIRSKATKFGIDPKFFDIYDLHIHVPAGAIPKDGPSAGVTIAAALASILSESPVDKDVAMTGEISLSGSVLPVGGVKEKVLAARRAGIKKVILPAKNKKDVEEIPKEQIKGLRFAYVETIDEVVDLALTDARKRPPSGARRTARKKGDKRERKKRGNK